MDGMDQRAVARRVEPGAEREFANLEQLQRELARFDAHISGLMEQLEPVLRRLDEENNVMARTLIEEAPIHNLHEHVLEFGRLNDRMQTVRDRIRL